MENQYVFPHLKKSNTPITNCDEYERAVNEYKKNISILHGTPIEIWEKTLFARGDLIVSRCPDVLVAICPYCSKKIYAHLSAGIFSLDETFWFLDYDNGIPAHPDFICPHLFCIDGSLNRNGYQFPPVHGAFGLTKNFIQIASELPFIKPRVLNLDSMIGVLHSIDICEKYLGYPITYFCEKKPRQSEFCIGWARLEFVARSDADDRSTFSGKRNDIQDTNLIPWIQKEKLMYLSENEGKFSLCQNADSFPNKDIKGLRNPFQLKDNQFLELQEPDGQLFETVVETFMPSIRE